MDISVEVRSVGVAGGIRGEPAAEAGIVKSQAESDEARFKVEALARIWKKHYALSSALRNSHSLFFANCMTSSNSENLNCQVACFFGEYISISMLSKPVSCDSIATISSS